MAAFPKSDRFIAEAIALMSWGALAAKVGAAVDEGVPAVRAIWISLRHFTNLTNLSIAVTFTGLLVGWKRFANQSLLGGIAVSSGLVLVTSYWLISSPFDLSSGADVADVLLNFVVPLAVLAFWFESVPKGKLTFRDPFLWLIYPLIYFDYAILRGAAEGVFAYRFINGIAVGWGRTFWTALLILACYFDAGFACVWLDRLLGKPGHGSKIVS
jgi:hypothetical protein